MDGNIVETQVVAGVQKSYDFDPHGSGNQQKHEFQKLLFECLGIQGGMEEWQHILKCARKYQTMATALENNDARCRKVIRDCATYTKFVKKYCCPGNILYSQVTLAEFSDNNQVKLNQIITGLGDPYVDDFALLPGKSLLLTHKPRPGYTPDKIAIDFDLANNGTNYLDLAIQFYIGPVGEGPQNQGLFTQLKKLGSEFDGNQFLNKDGTQIHLDFPPWQEMQVTVGSVERMLVKITHNGAANNLTSASVRLMYDAKKWWELCDDAECG